MVRRLDIAGLGLAGLTGLVLLASASPASAQALTNCKVPMDANSTGGAVGPAMTTEPVEGKPDVKRNRLAGNVEIVCDDTRIYADEIEWVDDDDWVYARGHVLFEQPTVRINADSARLNRKTHLGT